MSKHQVTITSGGSRIGNWTDYTITSDMLSPANTFEMTLAPLDSTVIAACTPDEQITVEIDGVVIMTGYIDDRDMSGAKDTGSTIAISGRDKAGRLVDESADLKTFRGESVFTIAQKQSSKWFDRVSLSNATNRDVIRSIRGRGDPSIAKSYLEPVIKLNKGKERLPRKVQPGDKKWDVIMFFLEKSDGLMWASANGEELILGKPNYDQEVQYRFFAPTRASARQGEGNIQSWKVLDSVGEMYSSVECVGASRGDSAKYGKGVAAHSEKVAGTSDLFGRGAREFIDGTGAGTFDSDGVGGDFKHRKKLIIQDDEIRNSGEAKDKAIRELQLMAKGARVVEITVEGHSQLRRRGAAPALYAFDCIAEVEIEEAQISELFLITSTVFSSNRADGDTTKITMMPVGTELRL